MNWRHTDWHYADACEAFSPGRHRAYSCSYLVEKFGPIPIEESTMVEKLVAPLALNFKALDDIVSTSRENLEAYWRSY